MDHRHSHNFIDLTGQMFGKLKVIEFLKVYKQRTYWKCICECGKEIEVKGKYLRNGDTCSCGCLFKENVKNRSLRSQSPFWTGQGELPGIYLCEIKKRVKQKHFEFNLTKEYLWDLFLKQNRKCALSGIILAFHSKDKVYDGTASLDRIDSSKGYIEGNVQWVHKDINIMKWNKDQNYFLDLCRKIVNNNEEEVLFIW